MATNNDYLKEKFWSLLRQMEFKPNNVYPLHLLEINLYKKLNPKEREEMDLLIDEMLNEGLIVETTEKDPIQGLKLTRKGYDNLY